MIKAKSVNPTSPERYMTAHEMMYNLNQMFEEFDRKSKTEAELLNLKFAMGVSDPKKSFPAFYARFIELIAPLELSDSQKRNHFKRTIN